MGSVRKRLALSLFAAAVLALVVPSASADVCYGACGGTGGSGGSGSGTTLNRLAVFNATSAAAQLVPEGQACDFTIHRLKPRTGRTVVNWHTKDGTATAQPQGQDVPDYVGDSGVATFNAENPSVIHVLIQTNLDANPEEGTEHFFLVITKPRNGEVIDATGRCDIQDVNNL